MKGTKGEKVSDPPFEFPSFPSSGFRASPEGSGSGRLSLFAAARQAEIQQGLCASSISVAPSLEKVPNLAKQEALAHDWLCLNED